MKEDFLHYVWQYRLFHPDNLFTTEGNSLSILKPGTHNHDAGPDFFNAKVVISNQQWAGNIEIHVNGNDWNAHGHQHDAAYNNVVLHVVYQNPVRIFNRQGKEIPTLVLENLVPPAVMDRYAYLEVNKHPVPCHQLAGEVPEEIVSSMLSRALVHRMERKSAEILDIFDMNRQSWEQTCYEVIAANFGFKVNAEPFRLLARSLPVNILARYKQDIFVLEALLFGQAGFLGDSLPKDTYTEKLRKEYAFLRHKHGLTPLSSSVWKFSRMRPANFPTVRIAQFAALVHHSSAMFSKITETENLDDVTALFGSEPSEYWTGHYKPGVPSNYRNKAPGADSVYSILINSVVPLLFAYSFAKKDDTYRERAIHFLENIPSESNSLTRKYTAARFRSDHAFDSQALLELNRTWCSVKKCLHCAIGIHVLKQA